MTSVTSVAAVPAARLATRLVFLFAGIATAAWAPLVPFVKARAGLDDGTLGLLLLALGTGSILMMPLAGVLATRFGCRAVIIVSAVIAVAMLPLLAAASALVWLVPALFLFGAAIGTADVTINVQAIIVEREAGRPMMSGFHALFSVGGIVGAAGMAALLGVGATPLLAVGLVVIGLLVLLGLAYGGLLPYGSQSEGPAFALPRGIVLLIGLLCFVTFLAEGAMLDWSAVFLDTVVGMDPAFAGLGYAAFAAAMTVGRFAGDRIVHHFGPIRVLTLGGLIAASGFAIATLLPFWQGALFGYALVGIGASNIVPVLFSSVGRQKRMPESLALPAVSTMGYAGILAGPALIGFIAHLTSLSAALLLLSVGLIGVAIGARWLRSL
ncbi:MFS transporter [Niveispirillum irakense]|uniref:MFS transporter n=1 Tax=Niveispirillum irakense TaxID=34011 RepID=UPI0003F62C03|nr:MFS transporter [Niveispirillum irakense]